VSRKQVQVDGKGVHLRELVFQAALLCGEGRSGGLRIVHPGVCGVPVAVDSYVLPVFEFLLHVVGRLAGLEAEELPQK